MAQDHALLVRAFGEDNVNGLYALVDCKHDNAYLYALAGANSDMISHRLAAIWLEGMVVQDRKDGSAAQRAYMRIAAQDDSVETVDQARDETIDVLADVRAERVQQGIQCRSQSTGNRRKSNEHKQKNYDSYFRLAVDRTFKRSST